MNGVPGPETSLGGEHPDIADYLIYELTQGKLPSILSLNKLAEHSDYGRECAERVLAAIEADPELATQYVDRFDRYIQAAAIWINLSNRKAPGGRQELISGNSAEG